MELGVRTDTYGIRALKSCRARHTEPQGGTLVHFAHGDVQAGRGDISLGASGVSRLGNRAEGHLAERGKAECRYVGNRTDVHGRGERASASLTQQSLRFVMINRTPRESLPATARSA